MGLFSQFNSNNLNQRFAGAVPINQPQMPQMHFSGRPLFPFPQNSQTFYRPAVFQPPNDSPPQCNSPIITRTPSPGSSTSDSSSRASKTSSEGKKKSKASGWTEEETRDTLVLWEPKYDKLWSASNKGRVKIWNNIFVAYKESFPDSERTLPQVKKRIQNLEYEYKLLKQRSQSTGEAGFKKIKQGFPYFDFFDDVMGHRDSVDPSKMAIEGPSTFASEHSSNTSPSPQLQESANDTEENLDADELQDVTGTKRKATDKSAKSARKQRKRRDEQQTEWFERSTEMLRESQRNQIEQTNAILVGFKDIFKDLASK